nr:hypothetical transcript [Hymenolepis microstoma]
MNSREPMNIKTIATNTTAATVVDAQGDARATNSLHNPLLLLLLLLLGRYHEWSQSQHRIDDQHQRRSSKVISNHTIFRPMRLCSSVATLVGTTNQEILLTEVSENGQV